MRASLNALCTVLLLAPNCSAGIESLEPCVLIFDTFERTPQRLFQHYRQLEATLNPDRKSRLSLQQFSEREVFKFGRENRESLVTGRAMYVDSGGEWRSFRLWSVHGRDSFDAFIAGEVNRRGSDTITVVQRSNKIVMTNPAPTPAPKGQPTISWMDSYCRFDDGVIAIANDDFCFTPQFGSLKRFATDAGKSDFLYIVRPTVVAKKHRELFLQQLAAQTGVQRQRRDNERTGDFLLRKSYQENYLQLAEMFLFDVDRIDMAIDMLSDDRKPGLKLKVISRPDSDLRKLIESLEPRRSMVVRPHGDAVAYVAANFSVPDDAIPTANALVEYLGLGEIGLGRLLKATISSRCVQFEAELSADDQGSATFGGKLITPDYSVQSNELAQSIGASVDDRGRARRNWKISIADVDFAGSIAVECSGQELVFNGITAPLPDDPVSSRASEANEQGEGTQIQSLLEATVDLKAFTNLDSGHQLQRLLQGVEQVYQNILEAQRATARGGVYERMVASQSHAPVESVLDRITDEGAYTADLKVRAAGGVLVVDVRVSNDLFCLAILRQSLTGQATSTKGLLRNRIPSSQP